MALSTFIVSCDHPHHHLQNFLIFPNWNSVPMKHWLPTPPPAPGPHHLLPVSVDLTPPGTPCEWNHTPCVLLCLASLTEHRVLRVHPCGSECQGFSPFHGWAIFLGVAGPHFVYLSSVYGHSGCFRFGAITNNAAVNICVQVFVWMWVLSSLGEILFPAFFPLFSAFWLLPNIWVQNERTRT